MGKSKRIIGICVSQLHYDETSSLVQTICRYARNQQFHILIYGCFAKMDFVNSFVRGEASVFLDIPVEALSALVILGETIQDRELLEELRDQALEAGTPVITVDYEMEKCFNIQLDYQSTFEQLVRHVVEEHHCQNPFFMAGFQGNDFSDERMEVYKKVLRENGLPVREEHIAFGDFWEQPAKAACERWMERTDDLPDAIICANDMMAITVCNVLKEHNLRVPQDVIVTGFDGIELERYCTPRLTTARVDQEEIGMNLIELVKKNIENPGLEPYSVMIPFHMRRSESCGCKPIQVSSPNQYVMEVYGRMAHNRLHVNDMFYMMTRLTEGYSMMEVVKKLYEYIAKITSLDLLLFVNRKFCQCTDIPLPKKFQKDNVLILLEQMKQKCRMPLLEVENKKISQIPDKVWGEGGQILFLPLHWQEEVYGYMAIQYSEDKLDYEKLSDFMMTLGQVFGTVKKQSLLHEMYIRDALTSLYNRRGFYGELSHQMKCLPGKTKKIFLASVDLDRLKYINDNFGHSEGDIAIRKIGEILDSSIFEGGFCARFGGDEFVAAYVWDDGQKEMDYKKLFENRMKELLDKWNQTEKKSYQLSASCGMIVKEISCVGDIDDLMKQADNNMYHCKEKHHSVRAARRDD